MRKIVRGLKESLSRKRAAAGRRGGCVTVARYGVEHMQKIGAKGAKVFHSRYRLTPVGTSQFAVVHRETGEVKSFLDGMPFKN